MVTTTEDPGSASEDTVQATQSSTVSTQTLAPSSEVSTTGNPGSESEDTVQETQSSTVPTQTLGPSSVVTTTEDPGSESDETVQETQSSTVSTQTLAPSSVVTTTGDPGSSSQDTVQETKRSIVSPTTLGAVNGRTLVVSSSFTAKILPSPIKTPSLRTFLTLKSDISTTGGVSSVVASGLVAMISPSRTADDTPQEASQPSRVSFHPTIKPSSRVPSVLPTSSKDVPSSVNPTSTTKDIVSNQTARPCSIYRGVPLNFSSPLRRFYR